MGLGMASSLFSGIGQMQAGKQEERAYDYNANVDLIQMSNEMVANEQQYAQLVGRQAAAYSAAGVDITRGSPLLMMAATAARGGRQGEQIYQAGTERAALERYYGRMAAWRGTYGGIQTFLKGISGSAQGYLDATGYVPPMPRTAGSGGDIPTDFGIGGRV